MAFRFLDWAMAQALVGAGGWGYFTGGLPAYARGFSFVEVNASFYRPVPDAFARRWREGVPKGFVFAVKASRVVSHSDRLHASARARAAFAHDLRTARILRAPFVILETPPDLSIGSDECDGLEDLAAMGAPGTRIGLEARAHRRGPLPVALARTMQDKGILDVVDLSQAQPRVADDVVYTRLFGPGPHNVYQFDDRELREIDRSAGDAVRTAFTFHGVRMYQDAARFLTFKRTGAFPAATASRGLASLEEALRPDVRFPTSREELVRDQGWKVIDLDPDRRVHASELLETLPARVYRDLPDMLSEIETPDRAPPRGPK